jgi:hypothetical protein
MIGLARRPEFVVTAREWHTRAMTCRRFECRSPLACEGLGKGCAYASDAPASSRASALLHRSAANNGISLHALAPSRLKPVPLYIAFIWSRRHGRRICVGCTGLFAGKRAPAPVSGEQWNLVARTGPFPAKASPTKYRVHLVESASAKRRWMSHRGNDCRRFECRSALGREGVGTGCAYALDAPASSRASALLH